ncbi:MAG: YcxB family protein [Oscillospiraceae bacterium]|nr:YcxB family protein [Oscillospiraceae bacterium]
MCINNSYDIACVNYLFCVLSFYRYEDIAALCERGDYYFFFLGKRYGMIFDKRLFTQGDPETFRAFIEQKTGKRFQTIK